MAIPYALCTHASSCSHNLIFADWQIFEVCIKVRHERKPDVFRTDIGGTSLNPSLAGLPAHMKDRKVISHRQSVLREQTRTQCLPLFLKCLPFRDFSWPSPCRFVWSRRPSNPTRLASRSQLARHLLNGILPSPTPSGYVFSGNTRKYYVAAEKVEWNYTPTGWGNWLGVGAFSHQ